MRRMGFLSVNGRARLAKKTIVPVSQSEAETFFGLESVWQRLCIATGKVSMKFFFVDMTSA